MIPLRLAALILRTGRVAEPVPADPGALAAGVADEFTSPPELAGSAQVRHVDAGSCNGCEIEVAQAFGPVYDAERYGARLVASPRHADVVLVTGVVTHNMAEPLRHTVEATPRPRVVLAVGDCARDCGAFAGGYGVAGAVDDVVPVDLAVPGCPPEPDAIVAALRRVTGR
jgi:formate hydrogenlyase subunit 7